MDKSKDLIIQERIAQAIYVVRNQKVMMDSDLAEMYGVETKVLNQAVKRNLDRFPEDFMFQISNEEWEDLRAVIEGGNEGDSLRSQIVTLKNDRGRHRKYLPYVFTEQGVAMLSSVLNSKTAIQVNISIMRVFVKMREWAANYEGLIRKIDKLSQNQRDHSEHISNIYQIIEELVRPSMTERKTIGFKKP